jgi:hypothetical protein
VKFSYLALVQDKKITCVLPANACCTVYVNCPFMSIKKVVCILREDYYVIIWLIVRICVFVSCPIFPSILIANLLWLILPTVRRSSVGSFVERDFFIRILFQVYFDFA